jgi:hypothetical protein
MEFKDLPEAQRETIDRLVLAWGKICGEQPEIGEDFLGFVWLSVAVRKRGAVLFSEYEAVSRKGSEKAKATVQALRDLGLILLDENQSITLTAKGAEFSKRASEILEEQRLW